MLTNSQICGIINISKIEYFVNVSKQDSSSGGVKMIESLKSCFFGGYNKMDTLHAVDSLMNEIYQLEQAISIKENGVQYRVPPTTGDIKIRSVAWGGFAKDDVNLFLAELRGKTAELRAKL